MLVRLCKEPSLCFSLNYVKWLVEVAFFLRKECEVIKYFFDVCPKEITVQRLFIITLWFAHKSHGSFRPHHGWSWDIFSQQPYKCVRYEMSHKANHMYFSCLMPVQIFFCVATCWCNNHFNETFLCHGISILVTDPMDSAILGLIHVKILHGKSITCFNSFFSRVWNAGTQCLQLYDILPLPWRKEGIHNDGCPHCIWCICGHSCIGSHLLAYAQVKVEVVGWIYHLADLQQCGFSSYCLNINL